MVKPSHLRRRAKAQCRIGEDGHLHSVHTMSGARVDDVIIVPVRQAARNISLSSFLLLVASFFLFKGCAIAWFGAVDYVASVNGLTAGTLYEQAAAFVMAPDVLSQFLANLLQGRLP
ncbi:MAG: hypothetical protein AAFZ10_08535 [Pseudomonadota bacterium]